VRTTSVAVVGFGAVGRGIKSLFPQAVVYDEPLGVGRREEVNSCEFAFIAVPTPQASDGACDTSIVEDVVGWIEGPIIVVRSTISVGTTERLRESTGKRIVFQPEYGPGETPDHPFSQVRDVRWVILGGRREDTIPVADLYKTAYRADVVIHQTDSRTAELTKYFENSFLAMKVTFCNEFYEIANTFGVDYNELRELWLLDPRIGRSHTFVMPDDRGFGGKCLPKDVSALIQACKSEGYDPKLLNKILEVNDGFRAADKTVELSHQRLPN
jgi:UDPglucose 6-dehydrogenase